MSRLHRQVSVSPVTPAQLWAFILTRQGVTTAYLGVNVLLGSVIFIGPEIAVIGCTQDISQFIGSQGILICSGDTPYGLQSASTHYPPPIPSISEISTHLETAILREDTTPCISMRLRISQFGKMKIWKFCGRVHLFIISVIIIYFRNFSIFSWTR